MAIPAASAAAITSSSRFEPPGCTTAVAPASINTSKPSAKGKNASEATAEPIVRLTGQPCLTSSSEVLGTRSQVLAGRQDAMRGAHWGGDMNLIDLANDGTAGARAGATMG